MPDKTTHTPGPWRVGTSKGFNPGTVYEDNGEEYSDGICQVFGVPLNYIAAEVIRSKDSEHQKSLSNARLIAAAPELLEACKLARQAICCDDNYLSVKDVLDAALAKVRGDGNA